GNLRCVVQPEGVKALQTAGWVFSSNILSEQCFRYEYDGRNRMVIKQVPGAAAVYMVYDNRDRLVMTQDGNMRTPHKWLATKYDALNRPSITWQYTDGSGSSLKTILDAAAISPVYPNVTPAASTILTETHYDDYTGITLPTGMSASFLGSWDSYWLTASTTVFPYAEKPTKNSQITTKGLVTWTKAAILDSTNGFLLSLSIYDDKARVIQTQQQNITGGIDVTSTQYSWAGQPLVVVSSQQEKKGAAVQTTVSVTKISYDDLGRLVKTEQRQSNSKVGTGGMSNYATISQIGYDALGQVKRKELGKRRSGASLYTNTPLETQDYDYNIRGWLLGVNRDYARSKAYTDSANTATITTQTLSGEMFTESSMDIQSVIFPSHNYFGFDLGYDKTNNNLIGGKTYTAPQYNGNITGMVWKDAHDSKVRKYDYTYDATSRLTGANNAGEKLGDFQDGNISGADYSYDANGNMTIDKNKKIIQIVYNILNLPREIRVDGTAGKRTIRYYYDAGGNKLRKVTIDSTTQPAKQTVTTYIGGSVYQNDTLQFFGTGEGRARPDATDSFFVYDYFLKDHLGNTRMVITDDYNVSSPILETSSYYPFGLQQKGIGMTASGSLHNYKNTFQKQERNEDFGIDMYEFKYRMDDPQIGRFWQIDPKSDSFRYNSVYAFSENKVINAVELEGLESQWLLDLYKASQKPNVQKYSQAGNSAWSKTASLKLSVAAGTVGGKVEGMGVDIEVGANGPKASVTFTSGSKTDVAASLAGIGTEASTPFGSINIGTEAGIVQYTDGKSSVKMIGVEGKASLGPSKTVGDNSMLGTGSANTLNTTFAVGANIGIVGFEFSVNVYQAGKAAANTIGTIFSVVGN
ncbi:MAG TPA: hypothetical protein VL053_13290, partial [Arachidicoccus sp.]|nr:hypothetical protein [Arachidicoccus sp.]